VTANDSFRKFRRSQSHAFALLKGLVDGHATRIFKRIPGWIFAFASMKEFRYILRKK